MDGLVTICRDDRQENRLASLQTEPRPAAGRGARPVLKWAGGKRQMLPRLLEIIPPISGKYIEPMIGGGALFFGLAPERAIIADRNPELVNFYRVLATEPEALIKEASEFPVDERFFYELRALHFSSLSPAAGAARTLFLNRTCFNGLYRVNKQGQFNVPWGRYARPVVVDRIAIEASHRALQSASILEGDYEDVLLETAASGDVVFLDPPYLPISIYSDFKRYTKEQFGEADHLRMRTVVDQLLGRGCRVIITNSNHPLMWELYREFPIEVLKTRRNINATANGRTGEDIIIRVER
jgi:DNA adenine methylase